MASMSAAQRVARIAELEQQLSTEVPEPAVQPAGAPAPAPAPAGGGDGAPAPDPRTELRKHRVELSLDHLEALGATTTKVMLLGALVGFIASIGTMLTRARDGLDRSCGPASSKAAKACRDLDLKGSGVAFLLMCAVLVVVWAYTAQLRPGPRPETTDTTATAAWESKRSKFRLWSVILGLAVGAVVTAAWVVRTRAIEEGVSEKLVARHTALAMTVLVLALVLWLLAAIRTREGGMLAYLIGTDNRFSTSYLQAALWTLAIGFVVLFLVAVRVFTTPVDFSHLLEEFDTTYLILLGGPFAAVVGASAITGAKVEDQTLQKVKAAEVEFSQVLSNDAGRADLVDAQFLIFNAIALVAFISMFAVSPAELPDLPTGLAALTSVSGIAYLGTKATLRNNPSILSVSVVGGGELGPLKRIVIRGQNFVAPGAEDIELRRQVVVRLGATEVVGGTPDSVPSSSRIEVIVPSGLAPDAGKDTILVTVVTAQGMETAPYPVTFKLPVPRVGIVSSLPLTPNTDATVTGVNFAPAGHQGTPIVELATRRLPVAAGFTDQQITFRVPPAGLPTGTAKLKVISTSGAESGEIDVPIG